MRASAARARKTERARGGSPLIRLMVWSLGLEDERHRGREALPFVDFLAEGFAPVLREAVVARPPIVLGGLPIAFDPAAMLETLQRGVERALVDVESSARDLLDA